MNTFLSHLHAALRSSLKTGRGVMYRPQDVPRGGYKEYPRMPQVTFPPLAPLAMPLSEALEGRKSAFTGNEKKLFSKGEIGALLGHALCGHEGTFRRRYPSGGALYPVETYFITDKLAGERGALFHYNPSQHVLERLWDLPEGATPKTYLRRPGELSVSGLIVFTAVWLRSSAKYGDLAYQHSLLEAGHMSENLLLVAAALGLKTRPMAGFDDEKLLKLLDLDPLVEQPVHSVTVSS